MTDVPPPGAQPEPPSGPPGWGVPPPPSGPPMGTPQGMPPAGGYQQHGYGYGYGGAPQFGGFWARFGCVILDSLIIGIPMAIVTAPMGAGLGFLLQIAVTLTYYAVLEGGPTGQTLGRKAVNLRVVDATTGQPGIGPGRAIGRYVGKIVSGIPLGLGYFWMLWDPKKQTWHDKMADTIVVRA